LSSTVVSRNEDLKQLRDEGYDVAVEQGFLLVRNVPFVNEQRQVGRGTLMSALTLTGEHAEAPDTHVVMWIGEFPCREDGTRIEQLSYEGGKDLGGGLIIDFGFSNKPAAGLPDHHAKMTHYASIIEGPARAIEPEATSKTFPPVVPDAEEQTPFRYIDTATSRAKIGALSERLKLSRVAIVGLGGTGSYVLDFLGKTPLWELHLFDEDVFSSHNAFRAPGAPSLEELEARPLKVNYLAAIYEKMRSGVVAHDIAITAENVEAELEGMEFVFICVDVASAKGPIVEALERKGIAFIDVGMGLEAGGEALGQATLGGGVRATLSTPKCREVLRANVSLSDTADDGEYDTNIQIAELNALNAALAVVKFKKHFGFYRDLSGTLNSVYAIDTESLAREEVEDET
jgi:ThiF family